jgi:alcohol dehydrogenase (NADP+)
MSAPEKFIGFQIEDPKKWTEFKLNELTPKPFGDYDVDIKILACGVCASDLHTVSGGWGEQHFPLCVGHGEFANSVPVPASRCCIFIALLVR